MVDSDELMHRTLEDTYGDNGSYKARSSRAGATSCPAGYKFEFLRFHGRGAPALHIHTYTRDFAEAADALCAAQLPSLYLFSTSHHAHTYI